jgi:hypothetical protein
MNLKLFIEILAPAIMFYFFENFLRQKLEKKNWWLAIFSLKIMFGLQKAKTSEKKNYLQFFPIF